MWVSEIYVFDEVYVVVLVMFVEKNLVDLIVVIVVMNVF